MPSRDSSGPDFAMGLPKDAGVVERTFCFIDLAGFTALTDAHGATLRQSHYLIASSR